MPSEPTRNCTAVTDRPTDPSPDLSTGTGGVAGAGNDAAVKQMVTGILTDFGWETLDIGGIGGARLLEPMCILCIDHAKQGSGEPVEQPNHRARRGSNAVDRLSDLK